jgi:hypothetical protein
MFRSDAISYLLRRPSDHTMAPGMALLSGLAERLAPGATKTDNGAELPIRCGYR